MYSQQHLEAQLKSLWLQLTEASRNHTAYLKGRFHTTKPSKALKVISQRERDKGLEQMGYGGKKVSKIR